MRAFSAFGRNGYTKEAAGAILDATRKMRRVTASDPWEEPADQFRKAALTALLDLKPAAVVEMLAERMKTLEEENVDFISTWISSAAADSRTAADLDKALTERLPVFLTAANSTDAGSKEQLLASLRRALPKDARLED